MEYETVEIARSGATAQSCPFLYHFHTESIPYIALADCSCMSDAVRPDSGPAKASASSHSSIRAVSRRADSVSVRRSRACVTRSRAQRRPSVPYDLRSLPPGGGPSAPTRGRRGAAPLIPSRRTWISRLWSSTTALSGHGQSSSCPRHRARAMTASMEEATGRPRNTGARTG